MDMMIPKVGMQSSNIWSSIHKMPMRASAFAVAAWHEVNKMEMKQQFLKKAEETETLSVRPEDSDQMPERYHTETHDRPKTTVKERKVFSRYG